MVLGEKANKWIYWRIGALACICLMLGGGMAPSKNQQIDIPGFVQFSKPWFNGLEFQSDLFVKEYTKKGFSPQDTWQMFVLLDRFASPVFANPNFSLTLPQQEALAWRPALAQELMNLRSPAEFKQWQHNFALRFEDKIQHLPDADQRAFSEFLGVGYYEWDRINNGMGLSSSQAPPVTKEDLLGRLGLMKEEVSPTQPASSWRTIGPYSSTSIKSASGRWDAFSARGEMVALSNQQAVERIQDQVQERSLLALRFSLITLSSLDSVNSSVERLDQYGSALGLRTGLGPEALGLHGRVFLVVGASDRPMATAYTSRLPNSQITFVQSPWGSLSHEWFHALSHAVGGYARVDGGKMTGYNDVRPERGAKKAGAAFARLERHLKYEQPNRAQRKKIQQQAQEQGSAFLRQQWTHNALVALGRSTSATDENTALEFSSNHSTSPYDAAVMAAHFYWIKNSSRRSKYSTWVDRRMLVDRMLAKTSWARMTTPEMVMKAGYFSSPEEWVAGAFQADMKMYTPPAAEAGSLLVTPLDAEAEDYAKHWTTFFKSVGPWWEQDRPSEISSASALQE